MLFHEGLAVNDEGARPVASHHRWRLNAVKEFNAGLRLYIATRRAGRRGGTIEALTGAVMGAIAMATAGFLLQRKAAKE